MLPQLIIGVAALCGLVGWGLRGLIIGAVAAYVFAMVVGAIFFLVDRGLLPRSVRKQIAADFIADHPELVRSIFPHFSEATTQKAVERYIEIIMRRAVADSTSMNPDAWLDRERVRAAALALIAEEPQSDMRAFLGSLAQYIDEKLY